MAQPFVTKTGRDYNYKGYGGKREQHILLLCFIYLNVRRHIGTYTPMQIFCCLI